MDWMPSNWEALYRDCLIHRFMVDQLGYIQWLLALDMEIKSFEISYMRKSIKNWTFINIYVYDVDEVKVLSFIKYLPNSSPRIKNLTPLFIVSFLFDSVDSVYLFTAA
ncbi:hypothetical protein GUJ93_ZPchr0012g19403 [Zizania palustris]|uniref:Uncharacterized protein n=1 Tax=Zizania palustris TaxID=103762 RepID=A0A8J6BWM7_ZIZPA|nr:hypothetical protein GUJ93_ZPchr0012g19403 [Zizania palustris]